MTAFVDFDRFYSYFTDDSNPSGEIAPTQLIVVNFAQKSRKYLQKYESSSAPRHL